MEAATWAMIGILGALSASLVGFLFGAVHGLGARIDGLGVRMGARIDGLGTRIDELGTSLNARIDGLGVRIDELGTSLNARIDTHLERHET